MASKGLVLSLVLLAAITIWVTFFLVSFSFSIRTATHRSLRSDIPHVSKCNLCESCERNPGQAHRGLRNLLGFEGDGHQDRPAGPAGRLDQLTDEHLNMMFSEMTAKGDSDALELDLHELEWDSLAAGIHAASGGLHPQQRTLLEYEENEHEDIEDKQGDLADRNHARAFGGTPLEAMHKRIVPTKADVAAKMLLPNCTRCYGCATSINTLKPVVAFGKNFSAERGASPEWVFTATLPEGRRQDIGVSNGNVMIKVWCMPIDKVHKIMTWACKSDRMAMRANQFLLAQQRVVEECGLLDATTKVWIDPVDAIVPEYGVHIWWNGLWMEKADGISMNQLAILTKTTMDLLQVKLNKTRVVEVALMDLLTSQCDRHSQNVFINEHGNIKVIDNLQAMHFTGTQCGVDSLFLPGTSKNEIVRFGNGQVHKEPKANVSAFRGRLDPMVLLDYRCYVDGGEIGNNYPPRLNKCLTKLANMSAEEVTQEYKFPMLRNGQALVSRARDMLDRGFEWTLKFGLPTNLAPRRYLWHQPCCSLNVSKNGVPRCGHEWNATAVFPIGDPYSGGEWHRKYLDPGQFVGGTRFEG
eukprot:gene26263-17365_t